MKSYLPAAVLGTVLTAAAISFGAASTHASAGFLPPAPAATVVAVDTSGS